MAGVTSLDTFLALHVFHKSGAGVVLDGMGLVQCAVSVLRREDAAVVKIQFGWLGSLSRNGLGRAAVELICSSSRDK